MNIQLIYCILFFLCIALILVFCEFLYKKGLNVEYTRKLAHTLSTLLCLVVPVLFSSHWYVLLITIISFSILYIGQRKQLLNSVHSVKRKTFGAYFLPVSFGATYYISLWLQNNIFFILPIVVLAISDPLACCFGKTFKSKIIKSGKTLIGTSVFFLSTFIICSAFLFSQSMGINAIGIAIIISAIVSGVELASPNGSDNLTIPLSMIVSLLLFINN